MISNISFSFNYKDKTKTKKITNYNKYEIVEEELKGVVFIDINGDYYIKVNTINFPIKSECYNINKSKNVYHRLYNGRLLYIRTDTEKELSNHWWIPFAPGCNVSGNIVKNRLGKTFFDIKKIWTNVHDEIATSAYKFYIDNIEEINKNVRIKINNELNGIK